jgi:Sulfotransferase family
LSQRYPDFFVVGQPKCGTTALHEMLTRHPQIFMPELKEPHFFVTDSGYPGMPQTLERYLEFFHGLEARDKYLALFASAQPRQLAGDGSASYLWSRDAALAISRVQPAAKIVAILREPASLARSLHLQMVEVRVETEQDLRRALDRELEEAERVSDPLPGEQRPPLYYADHLRYVAQLRRYFDLFPATQILVLIYDDFLRDNAATVRKILRFLGVNEQIGLGPSDANPTVRVRSPRLDRLVHSVSMGRGPIAAGVKRQIKAVTPARFRRRAHHLVQHRVLHADPKPVDEKLTEELRRRYRPEVVALSEFLDRDLVALWGYDAG